MASGPAAKHRGALLGQLPDPLLGVGRSGLEDDGDGPGDAEAGPEGRQEMREDDRGRVGIGDERRAFLPDPGVVDPGHDERDLDVGVEGLGEVDGPVILLGREASVAEVGRGVRGQEDEIEALEGGRAQAVDDLGLVPELAELAVLLLDVRVEELERSQGEFLGGEDAEDLLAPERIRSDERETGLPGLGRGHRRPQRVRAYSDISRYIRSLRASFFFLSSRSSSASAGVR